MAFAIHWKAPLQPKGFLRIIEIVLAILAFSLTAGFTVENKFVCDLTVNQTANETTSFTLKSSYPYDEYDLKSSNNSLTKNHVNLNKHYSSGAEFFVAWGVLSMIYCLVAIPVYMLVTANEELAKINNILILLDFGFTILWAVMWFAASVAWAAESNNLQDDLEKIAACDWQFPNRPSNQVSDDHQTFVQVNISIVFGFLNCFVWGCHVWWVLIDTTFYQRFRERRGHSSTSENL